MKVRATKCSVETFIEWIHHCMACTMGHCRCWGRPRIQKIPLSQLLRTRKAHSRDIHWRTRGFCAVKWTKTEGMEPRWHSHRGHDSRRPRNSFPRSFGFNTIENSVRVSREFAKEQRNATRPCRRRVEPSARSTVFRIIFLLLLLFLTSVLACCVPCLLFLQAASFDYWNTAATRSPRTETSGCVALQLRRVASC